MRAEERLVIACLPQETEREAFRKYLVDVQPVCLSLIKKAVGFLRQPSQCIPVGTRDTSPGSCGIPIKPVLSLPVQCEQVQRGLPAPAGHMAGVLSQMEGGSTSHGILGRSQLGKPQLRLGDVLSQQSARCCRQLTVCFMLST